VASAVLAIAFAVFNHAVAERDAQESAEQAQRDAQHSFEQAISLQRDLSGAELSERDLEARKHLTAASWL
jgi:hypothetical protein